MKHLKPIQKIVLAGNPKYAKLYPDLACKYKALQAIWLVVKGRTLRQPEGSPDSKQMSDHIMFGIGGVTLTDIGEVIE